ncbi:MAG: hypothetical protein M5U26_06010 [Planctomycetota bacterium]|nr:hypothetical protein [Planctomycetota bacterium]
MDEFALGDRALLDAPGRALLISRTPRRPAPGTPWVRAIRDAVAASAAAGEALVTGLGRDPFDLALAACREAGGAAVVVLQDTFERDPFVNEARAWLPERHLLVAPERPDETLFRAERLAARDRRIGALARRASVLHIREGGNMERAAADLAARGVSLDLSFQLPNLDAPTHRAPGLGVRFRAFENWNALTHYTREPDGAWPDEPRAAYLGWLLDGRPDETRTGLDALRRILAMRRILGSGRLMSARTPLVSFTARAPHDLPELLRWRKGLRRWTFRPYGIAIRREALADLGARAVRYLHDAGLKALAPEDRLFAQKHAPPETDWTGEAEWRLRGDLDLAALPSGSWRALVPTRAEAAALESASGSAVAWLARDP